MGFMRKALKLTGTQSYNLHLNKTKEKLSETISEHLKSEAV